MAKAAGKSIARFKCSRCFIASPVMRLPSYREDKFCQAYSPTFFRVLLTSLRSAAFSTRLAWSALE
jgi:hypothetical protein